MARMPRFRLRSRTAALVTVVGLLTAVLPGFNGGSGSAAPVLVADSRGAMPGADSVLDRPLDAVITVLNNNDAGAGSLRQAIISAAAGDTIVFAVSVTGTITLTTGVLDINKNLTIQGPGANVLAVSGNDASRVFQIQPGVTATIAGLTVRNGTGLLGSGIANSGILILTSVAVINNGVVGTAGGGIFNNGNAQLTMQQVLVANNIGTNGGGLEMNHGASMTNVTFFGNRGAFGAIFDAGFVGAPGAASMLNVTIAQNTATVASAGGGITWGNTDQLTIRNTIVANNQPRNCVGTLTSQGNNLEDTNTCGFTQPGDLPSTPAGLDPAGLQNNGGPTQTVRIQNTSAAFNGVTVGACPPPSVDQRGMTRPQGPRCDIGAVELALPIGDINQDGIVDIRDYGVWRTNFGQTNCGNPADLDGNCLVDIRDYGIWRQHFGEVASDSMQPGPGSHAPAR
jgi:hypothetical protein